MVNQQYTLVHFRDCPFSAVIQECLLRLDLKSAFIILNSFKKTKKFQISTFEDTTGPSQLPTEAIYIQP